MTIFTFYLLIVIFLIGLSFGSFLNVIVYRLPLKLSLVTPPSNCPACKNRLGAAELIPVVSYLLLKGRCRHCGVKISPRYPLVELATGILFAVTFSAFAFSIDAFFYTVLLFLLLAITLIDLEHRIVPNTLIAAGLITGIIFFIPSAASAWLNLPEWLIVNRALSDALFGFLAGGAVMLVIFLVSRGGMGAGDIKLMALIGLFVGLRGTALVMLFGFIFGALVGLTFMAMGKLTRKDALPFAPYLALATLIQVFWGDQIWHWYINLLR